MSRDRTAHIVADEFTRTIDDLVSEGGLELRYLDITSSTVSSRLAWSEYVFGPTQCRLMLSDSR
jgi:hypothetical protein